MSSQPPAPPSHPPNTPGWVVGGRPVPLVVPADITSPTSTARAPPGFQPRVEPGAVTTAPNVVNNAANTVVVASSPSSSPNGSATSSAVRAPKSARRQRQRQDATSITQPASAGTTTVVSTPTEPTVNAPAVHLPSTTTADTNNGALPTPAASGRGRGGQGRGRGRGRGAAVATFGPNSTNEQKEEPSNRGGNRGRGRGRDGRGGTVSNGPVYDSDHEDSADMIIDDHDAPVAGRGGGQQTRGGRGAGRGGTRGGGRAANVDFRGGGRGGRGGGNRGGGRGGVAANAVIPPPPAAAVVATAPVVVGAPAILAVPTPSPPPPPASRFAFDKDGVFTLVTAEPLSDSGVTGTTMATYRGGYDPTPIGFAPATSSSSPPPAEPSPDESEMDEKKAAEMDAWFHAPDKAPVDIFVFDEPTTELLEFIASLLEGDIQGIEPITTQQASVMRYLTIRPYQPMIDLIKSIQHEPTPEAITKFQTTLSSMVSHQLTIESTCHESQLSELEALQSIFEHELAIFQTHPISLKLTVVLQEFHCNIELGFLLPTSYPLEEPVLVATFIPPPYQGLKVLSDDSKQMEVIDDLLQTALTRKAKDLIGEIAIYECIEAARSFMERYAQLLQTSLEQSESEQSHLQQRVLTIDSISIFGRGRIERLEYEAIKTVQQQCDMPESLAKAILIQEKWDVQTVLQKHAASVSVALAAASSISPPPISSQSLTLGRQRSQQQRADAERFTKIQATYASYRTDPDATLSCSACFEDFQLREVAGHACGHVMCILCWRRMLSTCIRQGQSNIKCVGYKCSCNVEEGIIFTLLSLADYHRYRRFLQDSFIKLKNWKWCINAKCNNIASCGAGDEFAVVSCHCHALWCFSCGRAGHWPVSCYSSRAYESSQLVVQMRRKVQERIGKVTQKEEEIVIDVKKCPKCGTPWERNGGCNHFKCGTCQHHFCWICLKDWASHGVSWFQCVYDKRAEKKAEKLVFSPDAILTSDFEDLLRYCERELTHYLDGLRLARIMKELEDMVALKSSGSTVAITSNPDFPPELPSLLHDLQYPLPSLIEPILAFSIECHAILRSCYVFFALHYKLLKTFIEHRLGPYDNRSDVIKKVLFDLNQFEYFVDSLDNALIPPPGVRRSQRTIPMMQETMVAVRKYAKIFSTSLKAFQEKELAGQDEEAATKAFFINVDKSMGSTYNNWDSTQATLSGGKS